MSPAVRSTLSPAKEPGTTPENVLIAMVFQLVVSVVRMWMAHSRHQASDQSSLTVRLSQEGVKVLSGQIRKILDNLLGRRL